MPFLWNQSVIMQLQNFLFCDSTDFYTLKQFESFISEISVLLPPLICSALQLLCGKIRQISILGFLRSPLQQIRCEIWSIVDFWLFYWLQDTPRPLFHPVKKHFDVIMSSHLAAHKGLLTFDFIFCDSCWLWGWTESMLFDVPLLLTGSCMMHIPCLFFQFSNFSDRNNFELKIEFIHTFILFVCFFYSHFTFSVIEIETLWCPPRDIWSMFGWRWAGVLLYRASPNQAFEAFKLCHPACDSGIHWNTNYLLLLPHQKSTACLCVAYST